MAKIKITCDSVCDLTEELYKKYDVDIIPLGIVLGDDLKHDGVDVTVQDIYDYVAKTGVLPKTSANSMYDYIERWKPYVDDGYSIIHINISSAISACHQNARNAAAELGNVYPIDSLSLSSGSGLLLLKAAELIEKGLEAEEVARQTNEFRDHIDASFVLQTLEYLQKGGRCSSVLAFGANLLKLRPEIVLQPDGSMSVGKKYRGSAEKSTFDYVHGRLKGRDDIDKSIVFVTHSYADPAIVEEVKKILEEEYAFENVYESQACSTISSHCGAGTLGVLFNKK